MTDPGCVPPAPGRLVKRLALEGLRSDPGGWGVNPVLEAGAGPEAAHRLHLVSIRPGATRGRHAHGNATEWVLVFGGPARVVWSAPADGVLHESAVSGDRPVLFEIPAGVEHAITNTSGGEIYALAFYDHPDPETLPAEILRKQRKGEEP